ncbi:hypothetical protein ACJJTC_017193 [Scirpophaga incertulas]
MHEPFEHMETKTTEREERAKKLYRYVTDVARRMEESSSCHSMSELFSTAIEVQRQKLRDNCEKLLFLDPVNYGKKALELLWRKVYYETVCTAKKIQETDTDGDSYLYTHIICGIGHFHHFLTRIQSQMRVNCKDFDCPLSSFDEESVDMKTGPSADEMQFAKSALYLCLIYLGDLSRYQVELFQCIDPSVAARYYLQAAQIDILSGMSYNQLGNLYLDKNYNLDSACYYIHCLSCTTPFDGASGNLTKIFEKNSQICETVNSMNSYNQVEHIHKTITCFLSLIEIWYMNKNDDNIAMKCSAIAQHLKIAMDFVQNPLPDINKDYSQYVQAVEEEIMNPSYLNANLVHKIVLICLFTIAKMNELDEVNAFACKAFTLALLSQLLQKLLHEIESMGLKNPSKKYKPKIYGKFNHIHKKFGNEETQSPNHKNSNGNINGPTENDIIDNNSDSLQNIEVKNIKKISRRRRCCVASSDSSDMSFSDTASSDSQESNSDEDVLSDSSHLSEGNDSNSEIFEDSDIEESNVVQNGNIEIQDTENANLSVNVPVEVNGNIETEQEGNLHEMEQDDVKENEIQNFLLSNNYLCSIKLLQDWVLTEKELILSCGSSGETLFQTVIDLLNIFSSYFNPTINKLSQKNCKILNFAVQKATCLRLEFKSIPLPEDINLRGTNICKFDKYAAEWQLLEKYKPSVYDENIIRILNFIDFGNQIAKIVPRIRCNRSMKIYYLKNIHPPKVTTKVNHKRSREWHNSKKQHMEPNEGGLLRRLGKLWLASQVRELGREAAVAAGPALLVLDTPALHQHLRHVKHILKAKKFILLVPTVVLQELDDLKREQSSARDAIRWLEVQLRSGSRFLRAQRPGQSRPLPLLKYPRKAPPHVHNFIKILEFCNHFVGEEKHNQGGNGDPDNTMPGKSAPLLILLVGNDNGNTEDQYKEFSLTGAVKAAGISIENIEDFYAKWRQTVHKNGKKR